MANVGMLRLTIGDAMADIFGKGWRSLDGRGGRMSAQEDVNGLLAGASKTMANARSCWLVTSKADSGVDARPMGRLQAEPGDDAWLVRFITDARSHKAADIRRAAKVAVIFEVPADDAYVTLVGRAVVKDSAPDVGRLWKAAYDAFFASETDKANAIFLEIAAERLELWIRDVTPEPFAAQTTFLERSAGGDWRVVAG
jgi:general stress protein 26